MKYGPYYKLRMVEEIKMQMKVKIVCKWDAWENTTKISMLHWSNPKSLTCGTTPNIGTANSCKNFWSLECTWNSKTLYWRRMRIAAWGNKLCFSANYCDLLVWNCVVPYSVALPREENSMFLPNSGTLLRDQTLSCPENNMTYIGVNTSQQSMQICSFCI